MNFDSVESVDNVIMKINALYDNIVSKNVISGAHVKRLFKYYQDIVDPKETLANIAKRFGIPILNYNSLSPREEYNDNRRHLADFLKEQLDEKLDNIHQSFIIPEPPRLTPQDAQSRIVKYIDSDEYKHNQELLSEQRRIIAEQQRIIAEQQEQYEQLAQKTKAMTSKIIVDGIRSRLPMTPSIHDIPQPPIADEDITAEMVKDAMVKYGESEEFKQTHRNMSFDEYVEKTKYDENKIQKAIEDINNSKDTLEVDFTQFNNEGLRQIAPHILNWLGKHPLSNKYLVHYRVGEDWKSSTVKPEDFVKLKERLENGSLIYDMEEMPTWQYKAGEQNELPEWSLFNEIRITPIRRYKNVYKDNGGHFFEYLNNSPQYDRVNEYFIRLQIFDKLSIDNKTQREELNDCCLIYALKQSGLFTEDKLNLMRLRIRTRYLSYKTLKELCDMFDFKIDKHMIDREAKSNQTRNEIIGPDNASITVSLCQFHEHYFINEQTPFTKDYIKNIETAPADAFNKIRDRGRWYNTTKQHKFITSGDLVEEWFKQGRFTPITFATASILKTVLYDNVKDEDYPLDISDEKSCLQLIQPKEKTLKSEKNDNKITEVPKSFWYSDFEADTSGEIHKPYMNVLQSADGKISKTFKGVNCAKEFLEYLPDGAVCYFHNLAYDWCMFMRHAHKVQKVIKKGSKVYQAKIIYRGKKLTFKDSFPIFMCKLSVLPKSFRLKDIKKELFPYKYYTLERLQTNVGEISNCGDKEDKKWTEEDYKTFNENIDSIEGCRISENNFDMYKYAEFYCKQDVRILREAFEKLCDGFKNEFNIDVKNILTTPALANEFFNQNVYYPNKNLYYLGGHVRDFVSRAVYGGRCMCAYNKKWHSTKDIYDYDAVSLYPSAMRRLWTVEGKPEVLNVPDTSIIFNSMPDYLKPYNTKNGTGAFVIEIKIVKVNKHYAFPLIRQTVEVIREKERYNKKGILKKYKVKSQENINDDNITNPITMVVDNIALEDLIEFQQIEFQVIKGYVWNGNRDYRIQDTIQRVFDSRLKYKDEKNPLEQLYKLIMNSSYGKTIQKPVEDDLKFVSKWRKNDQPSEYERFIQKNYNKIVDIININEDEAVIKVKKQIDKHFNFSLLGVQVLSMSKRIMNEVMCLGFDIGCHIYYQDTDSIHIEADDLPKLEAAFEEKYKRPLRGKALGQFHSDFPNINNHDEIPKSIEAYFIMKKVYIDKLQDSTGDIDYMIRGKGLTKQSIVHAGEQKGGLMELYKSLYDGNEESFDLTIGQPSFSMNKDFSVSTRQAFIRKTKTTYDLGKREKYGVYACQP